MAKPSTDLSLGGAFLQMAVIIGSFIGGVVAYRFANDAFTHHVGKKDWYPFSTGYRDPTKFAPKPKAANK